MRQDLDVARMAAALRTPSLKYRNFANEPVRQDSAPHPVEDSPFSLLGDALAAARELPANTVLGGDRQVASSMAYEEATHPVLAAATVPEASGRPSEAAMKISKNEIPPSAPVKGEAPGTKTSLLTVSSVMEAIAEPRAVPAAAVPVPAARPSHATPVLHPASLSPRGPSPRHEAQGASLLQVLLGPPPAPPPAAIPSAPASASLAPRFLAPAATPPGGAPVVPSLLGSASGWPPAQTGGQSGGWPGEKTGSTLLDALIGASVSAGGGYPLLDALGAAMRGSPTDPSPSHWPAVRVDIALPELLRRVAAGVRSARTAA